MLSDERVDIETSNETAYDGLVAAIEASDGVLSLLLAVCDDPQLREATIRQYEEGYSLKLCHTELKCLARIQACGA
jgi:hypothetical protein